HGNDWVGGLAGYSSGTISNCAVLGGDITGNDYVGGLIGDNQNSVSSCYTDINGAGSVYGVSKIGGIAGLNDGSLNNSYCHSTVTGQFNVGGIVGYNDGAGNISKCYSTGSVSVSGSSGGLVGYNNFGTVTGSFWNIITSNQPTSSGGTGLYTGQMQEAGTYLSEGWDFTLSGSTWAMNDSYNNGYPFLRWQGMTSAHIWLGTTSTDWSTAGNWSENSIPSEKVIIPDATATDDAVLASDATSTISQLNVETDGSLTVQSASSGTGSLIVTGSASGNVNVQRYLDVIAKSPKWHYVSAPVSGVDIDDDFMTGNSIYSPNGGTNYNFYRWDEDSDYWIIYGSTGNPEAFNDATFLNAKGYALSRSSEGTINYTGTMRTEDVTYSATYTSGQGAGWNLIGNPFTSALAVTTDAATDDKFLTNTTNASLLDDNYTALYIWDEGTGYAYGEDDYKVIGNPVLGSYTQIDQDYVQPGQAFMVKVSSSGNLEFNEDMQAHADVGFFKEKETWPFLELLFTGQGLSNTTAIGFHEGMTKGLDPSYDVGKLKGNPNIALYTRLVEDNGIDFAIQALPLFEGDYSVPLGIDLSQAGEYSFEVIGMKQIPEDVHVYFEDKQNQVALNLRETTKYTCMLNEAESIIDRFMLHFTLTPFGTDEVDVKTGKIKIWSSINTINLHNPDQIKGTVKIFNLYGQQIMQTKLNGNQQQKINIEVPAAYYLVNVISEKAMISEKVFVY
ncbi:MAG: T9SS type A sorting domain-containing protein, partial [Bacteroidales bacterium]|nr:T9SS type A sorting domain-containing protein [Bacteroidales bacterium]